jgi:hypothetical protein
MPKAGGKREKEKEEGKGILLDNQSGFHLRNVTVRLPSSGVIVLPKTGGSGGDTYR